MLKTATIQQLRQQLQDFDCSDLITKQADASPASLDTPFEQAFSNLAHAYLQDKAPGLKDYEVGFQLLDRNQDNTKAIGVFGFKIGSMWLFAPVFFLNGDLKGHELLYIKNQDMFVPMKENWLNYLLNRRPHVLGEGVDKNLQQLGVLSPNLYQLSRSPSKYASDMSSLDKLASWVQPVLSDFAYFATTSPFHDSKYDDVRTPIDLVKDAGEKGIRALVRTCSEYPQIRNLMNTIYGEEIVNGAVKAAAESDLNQKFIFSSPGRSDPMTRRMARKRPVESIIKHEENLNADMRPISNEKRSDAMIGIRIISYKTVKELPGIGSTVSDDEKEQLQRGHIVIKDNRDDKDVSIAYDIDVPQKLFNPGETGLYEVLTKPGTFKKCFVCIGPYSNMGVKSFATVVDVESKDWINTHQTEVWAGIKYEKSVFDKWIDGLPDASLSKDEGIKMLVGPRGQSTLPFVVQREHGGEQKSFDVSFRTHAKFDRPAGLVQHMHPTELNIRAENYKFDDERILMTGIKGSAMRAVGSELLVPKGFKMLKLESEDKDDTDNKGFPMPCCFGSKEPATLALGSMSDFQANLRNFGDLSQIKVSHTGSHVRFNDGREVNPTDALIYLVRNIGLREKQARDVLETAKEKRTQRFLIKSAKEYDLQKSGPTAPPMPEPSIGVDPMTGGMLPTYPSWEANLPIPGMHPNNYDRNVYDPRPQAYSQPNTIKNADGQAAPDKHSLETAMSAGKDGQKEVFDTAMLGSLLRTVRDDSMTDKYIGDLMKGMDRLGRILFLSYWNAESFEDRFGKQQSMELENDLRDAFDRTGKIVLDLKQKTIDPHPSEDGDMHPFSSVIDN